MERGHKMSYFFPSGPYLILPHLTIFFSLSLKPLDVECMRALHKKVNLVPVLAKADSMTQDEVKVKKARVSTD